LSEAAALSSASFAGDGIFARDHSASTEKNPVTFAAICRASSRPAEARLPDLPGAPDQVIF
jgi:hypothetical protein